MSFEKKLITSFKQFVNDDCGLELDFRKHVFLENQYGASPQYSYSDAEAVLSCVFGFLDKFYVDYNGRYNFNMEIDKLRTSKLKDYLLSVLTQEIDKEAFNAITAATPPKFDIINAFISSDLDNPCLCVDVDNQTMSFIMKRLNISEGNRGSGTDGFINIQYPRCAESQLFVAGGNFSEDIEGYYDDDLVLELIGDVVDAGESLVSRRDYELEALFGTPDITSHDNLIEHGYTNGLNLALLENNDTGEAYVTFECVTWQYEAYFPLGFKAFGSIKEARAYVRSHIGNYLTLQDFGISHDIYQELSEL